MENLLFPFCSVPPLAPQPVVPKTSKKEQFPFSPGPKRVRMAVHETQSPHSRPPLLSPVGSRVRSEDAMPSPTPPAQPWSQVSVAPRTQTPLRNALPSESGPCAPLRCPTAGTSVAPLVPLVRSLGAWLALPRPSRWLLRTIRLGYAIQFARHPPKFRGVRFTSVLSKDAPVLRAEVAVLLAKDAMEPVPPAEMKSGFYSPYFIVPKKGGGLRPILDLRVLNRALHKLPFRMLTQIRIFQCIRPFDWFAAIDLKDAYFHVSILPRHRPFIRFAFEGRAYQYKVLPFGLSLSPRVFTKVVEAALVPLREAGIRVLNYLDDWLILAQSRALLCAVVLCGAQPPQPVGASGQLGKEQTLPCAEDLFSRHGVGLGQPHSTSLSRACSVDAELPGVFPAQEGGSTETLSEAPWAYGIRSRCHAARIASYETASALASRPGPEMGMATRHVPGLSHPVLPSDLQPVVRACFSSGRSSPSASIQACCCINRCLCHGLGCHLQRACSCGALNRAPTAVACQLPRVASSMACSAPLQNAATRQACTGLYGQHCDHCVHQPPRWSTLPSHVATRPPSPPLESEASEVASRRSCPRQAQSCSRRALTSARPSGRMATPPRGSPADLETLRGRSGRPVCLPRHVPLPAVLLPVRGDPRHGRAGTQLASGPTQIYVSPSEPCCRYCRTSRCSSR